MEINIEKKIIKKFEAAIKSFWDKKYEKARAAFEKIRESSDIDLTFSDKIDTFISACEQRLGGADFTPRTAEEHYLAGIVHLNNDELEESIKHLSKALGKVEPNDAWLFSLACAYARKGQSKRATETLEKAIKLNSENQVYARNCPDFHSLRGKESFKRLVGDGAKPKPKPDAGIN